MQNPVVGIENTGERAALDEAAAGVSQALESEGPAATILVVDDEDMIRQLFQRILVDAGYRVFLANDGCEALKISRAYRFDVVLTDLVMPGREGIETIRILRKDQPHMKIIAVSGAFGGTFLEAARLLGANIVLPKPVSSAQLLAAVGKLLE